MLEMVCAFLFEITPISLLIIYNIAIKTCQKKGKTVLMSLGGAAGSYGFANNADAEAFADTLWNIYGAGKSSTRPFGDAVIDGFDLDIEGGGSTGYAVSSLLTFISVLVYLIVIFWGF